MLARPEQARLLKELEDCSSMENADQCHHEAGLSTQEKLKDQVMNFCNTMSEMGNPFLSDKGELLTVDSHDVFNQQVVVTVRTIYALGKQQFDEYY